MIGMGWKVEDGKEADKGKQKSKENVELIPAYTMVPLRPSRK